MKKFLLGALLICVVSLFNQPSASASPILSQDILIEQNGVLTSIGSVSVNVADAEDFDPIFIANSWLQLDLFGYQFEYGMVDFDAFEAQFDITNLMAGFEFLSFDVEDLTTGWAFLGFFDFAGSNGPVTYIDVFSVPNESFIAGFFGASLGDVSVAVPAPTTFGLMLMAMFGLMMRRQAK